METLIMVGQLLLGLSLLVGLHEFGHLITAKMFGMRVEKFSIGFPPKIFGFKIGETEYSLSAIPLGGFVKISGMIDESLDTEALAKDPEPYEFRAKPAWQRLIVMLGGIIVNVIIGIVIFVVLVYKQGETYVPKAEIDENGIVAYELAQQIGLQTGDRIINVSGKPYDRLSDLYSPDVLLDDNTYYTVNRDGEEIKIDIPAGFIDNFSEENAAARFVSIRAPFTIAQIEPGSFAEQAGLQVGDRILSINDQPIEFFDQFQTIVQDYKGQDVNLLVSRKASDDENALASPVEITATVNEAGQLGFYTQLDIDYATKSYSFGQSLKEGTNKAFGVVFVNAKAMGKMFTGDVSPKNLSGPIGIAKIFGNEWDWIRFWANVALISMILAFMNLLPIPALDGGHVVFLLYEMVSGRKPSDKFLENAQKVGMVLLLTLMVFVIGNDIWKLF
ncbi:RIP metalloprotease RseP [Penaeicola halotolerans]|uniref:RIP metalloprotease RseP n=1 Tax=Penaeicola halotolerans TaxID=2793196 RepID=UPI0021D0B407|nr:RIP metalloprotease RseP [Penaeicola halotolerans]